MKTTINFASRTVWTGFCMIALGALKITYPEYVAFEVDPPYMISGGLALIFLKS